MIRSPDLQFHYETKMKVKTVISSVDIGIILMLIKHLNYKKSVLQIKSFVLFSQIYKVRYHKFFIYSLQDF